MDYLVLYALAALLICTLLYFGLHIYALNVLYITRIYIYKCTQCTTYYVAVDYVALGPFHTNWDDRLLANTSTTLSYNPSRFTLWTIMHCIGYAALHVSLGWVALLCMHGDLVKSSSLLIRIFRVLLNLHNFKHNDCPQTSPIGWIVSQTICRPICRCSLSSLSSQLV